MSAHFRIEYAVVVGAALLWGTLHPIGKVVLEDVDPVHLALVRAVLTFVTLSLVSFTLDRAKALTAATKQWALGAVLGFFGFFLASYLSMSSLAFLPAGVNSVLANTSPVFVAIIAVLRLHEGAAGRVMLGVLVAFVGVACLSLRDQSFGTQALDLGGVALALAGSLSWAVYVLGSRRMLATTDAIAATAVAAFFGTLPLLTLTLVGPGFGPIVRAPLRTQLLLAFVGVGVTAVTYTAWNYGVRHLGAARVSVFQYLIPLSGLAIAVLYLGEVLSPPLVLGVGLILAGVWMAQGTKG